MNNFKLISDSSCDLPAEFIEKYDITLIPYYVTLDGENYLRENVDITVSQFYKAIKSGKVYPKTSLPPIADYEDMFRPLLSQGLDILCICLTSKFSGSYQSAMNAKENLKEEFPDRKIAIIDSYTATFVQGLLVIEAAKLRARNKTIDEIEEILNTIKLQSDLVFTVDSLESLKRGGRIGKAASFLGSLLNIKPIIYLRDGELIPGTKIRGRKKAISEVISLAASTYAKNPGKYAICLAHSDCPEDVPEVEQILRNEYNIKESMLVMEVGPTIGTHVGPTVVGIGLLPDTDYM